MVRYIKNAIPIEILDLGLRDFKNWRRTINIDTLIDKNILSEMYEDMSISRGVKINIPIRDMNIIYSTQDECVLEMKPSLYPGRKLMSVTELIVGGVLSNQYGYDRNPLDELNSSVGEQLIGAFDTGLECISDREVYVANDINNFKDGELVVLLSYGTDMREINHHYYMRIGELAIKKAESWLYNKLKIKMNTGTIYRGHNIESINNIIDKWEDTYKEYHTEMNTIGSKLLFMNDKRSMKDYMGLHFNIR